MPSPQETLLRICGSPMPTYMMSGLDSEISIAPTELLLNWPSPTGSQVRPASGVFHSPPEAPW